MTERIGAALNLSWSRVSYDERAVFTNLIDYKYLSIAPTLSYAVTERDTVSLQASAGRYDSGSGITASKDYNLQLGLERDLSEIWQFSASAGYTQSRNRQKYFFGPFYLGEIESRQKSSVYAVNWKRRGESLFFSGGASRALRPSGFAFLSQQDALETTLSYQFSERWSFAANGSVRRSLDSFGNGRESSRTYAIGELSAHWRWTPDWEFTLRATRVGQRYDESAFNADSNGINLQVTRQFQRLELN